jgi:hypothetical protein
MLLTDAWCPSHHELPLPETSACREYVIVEAPEPKAEAETADEILEKAAGPTP